MTRGVHDHAIRMDAADALLPVLLRALADGHERLPAGARTGRLELEWLVRCGLGPLLYTLRPADEFRDAPGAAALLRGADLTSSVITAEVFGAVEQIIVTLRTAGIEATLLKGVAYASRYYRLPHMRVMGDVDMLVPEDAVGAAESTLHGLGYRTKPGVQPSLHHVSPLIHPVSNVHVELHHALLPPVFAAALSPPLDLSGIEAETREGPFGTTRARYLSPECDLMLIAAGWCRDTTGRLGLRGTPRPLVDAVVLLEQCDDMDWGRLLGWSRDTFSGACLAVLLTYLDRLGAWRGPAGLPQRMLDHQPFVNAAAMRAVHWIFDRHVVRDRRPGRVLSVNVLKSALESLIAPRPAWHNIAGIPLNVAFPRNEPRRFSPRFVLSRLGSLLRPR